MIMVVLAQIAIVVFGFLTFHFEWSKNYRDCFFNVSNRLAIFLGAVIIPVKMSVLYSAPFIVQLSTLIMVICSLWLIYEFILKKQIKISNFKLKKLYLGKSGLKVHTTERRG